MNTYLSRIIECRKAKGFTQKQLADKMGITQVNYSNLENGKTQLTLDRVVRIANILEVDMITLLYPDFKEAQIFQELRKENGRLKKNNDQAIEAIENMKKLLNSILDLNPSEHTKALLRSFDMNHFKSRLWNESKFDDQV